MLTGSEAKAGMMTMAMVAPGPRSKEVPRSRIRTKSSLHLVFRLEVLEAHSEPSHQLAYPLDRAEDACYNSRRTVLFLIQDLRSTLVMPRIYLLL